MNHKYIKNSQSGFSLIEIVVSMVIILILFDLFIIEMSALKVSERQRYENIAYHIANKKMENLRSTTFSSLPSSGSIVDTQLALIPTGAGTYTISDYAGFSGLKEFVVTVTWNDGENKSVVLKTLAGPNGLNPE